MKISKNDFFREVTLRICGSLDIEQALYQSFLFMQQHIPADRVALSYYDPEEQVVVIHASATLEGGEYLNVTIPLTEQEIAYFFDPKQFPDVLMLNRIGPQSVADRFVKALGHSVASFASIRMRLQGQIQGNLGVIANGKNRFTNDHLWLLKMLSDPFAVALSNSRRYQELSRLKDSLEDENRYLQQELRDLSGDEIIGDSPQMRRVIELLHHVAPRNSPVLISGETGTGKELVARAVHDLSPRREGPFIKVNCGAIPPSLMDSELFGHEKGAFTGANARRRGRFERAHNGTVFLDEVGELPQEAQVRLLRVLQEKEIERVGGSDPVKIDIRIVAATNRDLHKMVESGTFREDLYYRINVFPVKIPPLRERLGDIMLLVSHFLIRKAGEMKIRHLPEVSSAAIVKLTAYSWPGNVRELEHAVERALILHKGDMLTFEDLTIPENLEVAPSISALPEKDADMLSMDHVMADHIRRILRMSGGRVEGPKGAARILGMKPGTLRYRMKKLGIAYGRRA